MSSNNVPLSSQFSDALQEASKAVTLPAIEDSTQVVVRSCLTNLLAVQSRVESHSLFSPNESLDDISTRNLPYLTVPYVIAEAIGRIRATEPADRSANVAQAEGYYRLFLHNLENYNIVSPDDKTLYESRSSLVANPTNRRELKIKQFKRTKEIRSKIEALHQLHGLPNSGAFDDSNNFGLIAALLPSKSPSTEDQDESDSNDENIREISLLLLRLLFTQTHSQLESLQQEIELLKSMPSQPVADSSTHAMESDPRKRKQKEAEDSMWKLDRPVASGNGPLLDPTGKPLQPFTLLPSGAGQRERIQGQVFGPGHRLPSMTIDEYLEIEQQRGNIISGGGPASQNEPTSSEALELAAEMDGTAEGAEKEEEKRLKDEKWARYTDENPKGIGNTMNRG